MKAPRITPPRVGGAVDPVAVALRLRDAPLEPTVELLRSIHARAERRARRRDPDAPAARPGYERARQLFYERAAHERGQKSLADAVVEQVLPAPPMPPRESTPLQQELRLQAPPRGVAAGRFVLANELARRVVVRFRAGPLRAVGGGAPLAAAAPLRVEPEAAALAPGEERVMRIEFDLGACAAPGGSSLEVAVDLLGDEELLLKLWVAIAVRGEP